MENNIQEQIKLILHNIKLLAILIKKEIKYAAIASNRKQVIKKNRDKKIVATSLIQDFCEMDDDEIYVIDLIKRINDYLHEFDLISNDMILPDEKIKNLLQLDDEDPIFLADLGKLINQKLVK